MKVNSWISSECKSMADSTNGSGVFARTAIAKGEIVSVFGGKIATADECEQLAKTDSYFVTYTLSLYPGIYLASHAPAFEMTPSFSITVANRTWAFLGKLLLLLLAATLKRVRS